MKKNILLSVLIPTFIFSWSVTPSRAFIDTEKGSTILTIKGAAKDEAQPVSIYAASRIIDIDGKETYEKIKGKFHIIPSQFLIKPNETKLVRLIWRGKKDLDGELAYRIIIEGVPITTPKVLLNEAGSTASIANLTRFVIPAYVRNKKFKNKEKLSVISHEIKTEDNNKYLLLKIKNTGKKHKYIKDFSLTFKLPDSKKTSVKLEASSLKNSSLILSKHERILKIAWSDKFPQKFLGLNAVFN